jgi:hypothetical protein
MRYVDPVLRSNHAGFRLRQFLLAGPGLEQSQLEARGFELGGGDTNIPLVDIASCLADGVSIEQRGAARHAYLRFRDPRLGQPQLGLGDVDILGPRAIDELAVKRFGRLVLGNAGRELGLDVIAGDADE